MRMDRVVPPLLSPAQGTHVARVSASRALYTCLAHIYTRPLYTCLYTCLAHTLAHPCSSTISCLVLDASSYAARLIKRAVNSEQSIPTSVPGQLKHVYACQGTGMRAYRAPVIHMLQSKVPECVHTARPFAFIRIIQIARD